MSRKEGVFKGGKKAAEKRKEKKKKIPNTGFQSIRMKTYRTCTVHIVYIIYATRKTRHSLPARAKGMRRESMAAAAVAKTRGTILLIE